MGEFLRRELHRPGALEGPGLERGWRPAPARIAGLASAVILVFAVAGFLVGQGMRRQVPAEGQASRGMASEPPAPWSEEPSEGRVALIEGDVSIVRDTSRVALHPGDRIGPGDVVEAGQGSAVGFTYGDGPAVVLDGKGRLNVRGASSSGVRISLDSGVLASRVPRRPVGEEGMALRVEGSNAEIFAMGTLFSIRAEGGRLLEVAVGEGEVEVVSKENEGAFRVGRSTRLDLETWKVGAGEPDAPSTSRLALIVDGMEKISPAIAEPGSPGGGPKDTTGGDHVKPPILADRMRAALEAGDVSGAIMLYEKHGPGAGSAEVLGLAGDAYRKAGRWSDAADAYLAEAEAGSGAQAEMALIRAADIVLRKLHDPKRAVEIVEVYLVRFPDGGHLDEALYLGGLACSSKGDFVRSISLYEEYIERYPFGPHVARVHLALAKIHAYRMSDCPEAAAHIAAVKVKAAGTSLAAEAMKIESRCPGVTGSPAQGTGVEESP